jgi:hypothetical protein
MVGQPARVTSLSTMQGARNVGAGDVMFIDPELVDTMVRVNQAIKPLGRGTMSRPEIDVDRMGSAQKLPIRLLKTSLDQLSTMLR